MKPFYAVLDFEANCSSEGSDDYEIIEFPVILVDSKTGQIVAEFREFIQLVNHQQLSDFIKDFTHITDSQVKSGLTWSDCLVALDKWCQEQEVNSENTTVITCGDWDLRTMLPKQLELTKTTLPYRLEKLLTQWVNIKKPFKKTTKNKEKMGMAGMLSYLDLELTGHHHSGIDDCRNIAKICHRLVEMGADVTRPNCRKMSKFVEI